MNLPDDPPPATGIQNLYDEIQTSPPRADNTKINNNSNENIEFFKNVTPPLLDKK